MSNPDLLPCPFCGDNNMIIEPYGDESYIRCQECKCEGPVGNYIECVELWNTRPGESMAKATGAAQAAIIGVKTGINNALEKRSGND